MIRRSPTRIEMRLEDLKEYEEIKKALEAKKDAERKSSASVSLPTWGGKVPQSEIQERIGYVPSQQQQHSSTQRVTT